MMKMLQCAALAMLALAAAAAVVSVQAVDPTSQPVPLREEWQEHFSSSAVAVFDSDEAMTQAVHELWNENADADQGAGQMRAFVATLNPQPGDTQHAVIRQLLSAGTSTEVGKASYFPVSQRYSVLYTTPQKAKDLMVSDVVQSVFPLHPELKSHATLKDTDGVCSDDESASNEAVTLSVDVAPMTHHSLKTVVKGWQTVFDSEEFTNEATPITLSHDEGHLSADQTRHRIVHATVACSQADKVVSHLQNDYNVLWMERRATFEFSNKWASGVTQAAQVYDTPIWSEGLNGTDEIVGISDTGIDMTSCFFYDNNVSTPYDEINYNHRKVVTYITYVDDKDVSTDGHGTHVCGSAAGAYVGTSTYSSSTAHEFDGMGKGGKIAFMDIGDADEDLYVPDDLNTELLARLYDAGAYVFSNSWGSESNAYDIDARQVDEFMAENLDTIVYFAAGNYGEYGSHTVGTPATGKNIVAVGCTMSAYESWYYYYGSAVKEIYFDFDNVAYFSSQGPTQDMRLKPDLMAPGFYTTSAYSDEPIDEYHCDVVAMAGTSMATPTTAGNTLMARQYFVNGYYPDGEADDDDAFTPLGAMLKAFMVHSSQPMNAILESTYSTLGTLDGYPSNIQGYGRIELDEVFAWTTTSFDLLVMGAYDDDDDNYASLAASGDSDIYEIEITDSSYDFRVTLAWSDVVSFSGSGHAQINDLDLLVTDEDGNKWYPNTMGHEADHNNSVEMVNITLPDTGTYYINVSAYSITEEQTYGLVMTGAFELESVTTNSIMNAPTTRETLPRFASRAELRNDLAAEIKHQKEKQKEQRGTNMQEQQNTEEDQGSNELEHALALSGSSTIAGFVAAVVVAILVAVGILGVAIMRFRRRNGNGHMPL